MTSVVEPKEYTRSDLRFAAYAGLFDGEGCIGMYPAQGAKFGSRWRYTITLRVGMTSRDTLARMYAQFGAGTLNPRKLRPPRKQAWIWFCAARKDVIRILGKLRPHLDLKIHEANLALDYLLPESLTDAQQDRIYRAMKLPKCRFRLIVRNQYGAFKARV